MGPLRGVVDRQAVRVGPLGKHPARFHGGRAGAMHLEAFFNDDLGTFKNLLDFSRVLRLFFFRATAGERHREHFVVRFFFMDLHCPWQQRGFGIEHRRQFFVINDDEFGGVNGDIFIARDDHGDGIAVELHSVDSERIVQRIFGRQIWQQHRLAHRFTVAP